MKEWPVIESEVDITPHIACDKPLSHSFEIFVFEMRAFGKDTLRALHALKRLRGLDLSE